MISTGKPLISSFSPPSIFDPEKIVDLHKWKKRTMPEILKKGKKRTDWASLSSDSRLQSGNSSEHSLRNILHEIIAAKT